MKTYLRLCLRQLFHGLIHIVPKTALGDRIITFVRFVRAHKRLPGNSNLISDYLFLRRHSSDGSSPLRAYVSDKSYVKDFVTAKVGNTFNVPTLALLQSLDEARRFEFPERCCIKPTHLSGEVILRDRGQDIDFSRIEKWLTRNFYTLGREKNYRYLEPKLIIEPLIFDAIDNEDYKFFCFQGQAKFVQVDVDRHTRHTRVYFDRDWQQQDFSILKPRTEKNISKPENFDAMLRVADTLSQNFEFIRVDLYTDGDQIYVGELTNWPENGNGYFVPPESEILASRLLFEPLKTASSKNVPNT